MPTFARHRKLFLKFAHEVGSVGIMGALLAQLLLAQRAEGLSPPEFALMREQIQVISDWILVPSLGLVLFTGLLALGFHPPFHNAGWAWIKLATTILVLEATLVAVNGPAQKATALSARLAAGEASLEPELAEVLRHEQGGIYMMLFLSVLNIALAVWRPRFRRRPACRHPAAGAFRPRSLRARASRGIRASATSGRGGGRPA